MYISLLLDPVRPVRAGSGPKIKLDFTLNCLAKSLRPKI